MENNFLLGREFPQRATQAAPEDRTHTSNKKHDQSLYQDVEYLTIQVTKGIAWAAQTNDIGVKHFEEESLQMENVGPAERTERTGAADLSLRGLQIEIRPTCCCSVSACETAQVSPGTLFWEY